MAGFFPHTGGSPSGYTALPATTYATILDDIVADLNSQAGNVNGWTLHDDQRTGFTPLVLPCNVSGLNIINNGIIFTNGSAAISQTTNGRFRRNWISGISGTYISPNQVDWYYCSAIASQVAATLDRNYVGTTLTTTTGHNIYERSGPYIVLKHTSSQKTFYVLICRPVSYGISLRVQVFESWNSVTHVGTNGGPQEELRALVDPTGIATSSSLLRYLLFLLPDAIGLWVSGDPALAGDQSDFFYAGNLNPMRVGDNTCLIQACSNQDLSGIEVFCTPQFDAAAAGNLVGGASMFKNIAGSMWNDPRAAASYNVACNYVVAPRGLGYMWGFDRTNLDDSAKFQFIEMDAYYSAGTSAGFSKNEGKRGELRYVKCPVMNPTGMNLASLGPADDGNTYILFGVTGANTASAVITTLGGEGNYSNAQESGFAFSYRTGTTGALYAVTSTSFAMCQRWFMMPINV